MTEDRKHNDRRRKTEGHKDKYTMTEDKKHNDKGLERTGTVSYTHYYIESFRFLMYARSLYHKATFSLILRTVKYLYKFKGLIKCEIKGKQKKSTL